MIKLRKIAAIRVAMENDPKLKKITDQTPEDERDKLAEDVLDQVVAKRVVEAQRKKPGSLIGKVKAMATRKKTSND